MPKPLWKWFFFFLIFYNIIIISDGVSLEYNNSPLYHLREAQFKPRCHRGGTCDVAGCDWLVRLGWTLGRRFKSRRFPHQERPNPETFHGLFRVDAPDCKHGREVCWDVENDFQREFWRLHESNWYERERERERWIDEYLYLSLRQQWFIERTVGNVFLY